MQKATVATLGHESAKAHDTEAVVMISSMKELQNADASG